jgi:DNA-binding MarR family transcriptional regulator
MSKTRWLDAEQQWAWRSFLDGTARLQERIEIDLRQHGLSSAEYQILVELSEAPGRRMRMAELANRARQSRSRLTHTVARMEAAGLVTRQACTSDGRGVEAVLTEEGWELIVRAAPDHVAGVLEAFVDQVSREDFLAMGRAFAAVASACRARVPGPPEDEPEEAAEA